MKFEYRFTDPDTGRMRSGEIEARTAKEAEAKLRRRFNLKRIPVGPTLVERAEARERRNIGEDITQRRKVGIEIRQVAPRSKRASKLEEGRAFRDRRRRETRERTAPLRETEKPTLKMGGSRSKLPPELQSRLSELRTQLERKVASGAASKQEQALLRNLRKNLGAVSASRSAGAAARRKSPARQRVEENIFRSQEARGVSDFGEEAATRARVERRAPATALRKAERELRSVGGSLEDPIGEAIERHGLEGLKGKTKGKRVKIPRGAKSLGLKGAAGLALLPFIGMQLAELFGGKMDQLNAPEKALALRQELFEQMGEGGGLQGELQSLLLSNQARMAEKNPALLRMLLTNKGKLMQQSPDLASELAGNLAATRGEFVVGRPRQPDVTNEAILAAMGFA